jgi:RNA polymerase sigma factor (sigma-70 family)
VTNPADQDDEFAVFFRKEYKSIIATVMRAGASFEDAEDAVIEAMPLAADRFCKLEAPGAWVRVVAMRRFTRRCQRDRKRQRREQLMAATSVDSAYPEDGDLNRSMRSILDDLPPTQRIVLALHLEGYRCHEIASLINSLQDTVRSNLRYARRAMAAGLRNAGWNVS